MLNVDYVQNILNENTYILFKKPLNRRYLSIVLAVIFSDISGNVKDFQSFITVR